MWSAHTLISLQVSSLIRICSIVKYLLYDMVVCVPYRKKDCNDGDPPGVELSLGVVRVDFWVIRHKM